MPTSNQVYKFLKASSRLDKFLDQQSVDTQLSLLTAKLASLAVKHKISLSTILNELGQSFEMEYAFTMSMKDWDKAEKAIKDRAKKLHRRINRVTKPHRRKGNVVPFKGNE